MGWVGLILIYSRQKCFGPGIPHSAPSNSFGVCIVSRQLDRELAKQIRTCKADPMRREKPQDF
jgi:hypothetical protein